MKLVLVVSIFLFGLVSPSGADQMALQEEFVVKVEDFKAKLQSIRAQIQNGLSSEEMATLKNAIQSEEYGGVAEIRDKIIERIYLFSRDERDFLAIVMLGFGEARRGSSKTVEEIPRNCQVRAEMLAVIKVLDNRLRAVQVLSSYAQAEYLDILLAPRQFSFFNEEDPNWIKWVLGPIPHGEETNPDYQNFSKEYEFTQSLIAYLDFMCEKTEFCPWLESQRALHYCSTTVADSVAWTEDDPWAYRIPAEDIWVRLPPLGKSERLGRGESGEPNESRVFIQQHTFFENVRVSQKQLFREKSIKSIENSISRE